MGAREAASRPARASPTSRPRRSSCAAARSRRLRRAASATARTSTSSGGCTTPAGGCATTRGVGRRHAEPATWRALLARRFRYGTSAAPLARRHPRRLAPARRAARARGGRGAAARPAAPVGGRARGRRGRGAGAAPAADRRAAATALPWSARRAPTRSPGSGAPRRCSPGRRWSPRSARAAHGCPPSPCSRPRRSGSATHRRPRLDPVRWTAACVADDVAYGLGVWRSCLAHRTVAPLRARWR